MRGTSWPLAFALLLALCLPLAQAQLAQFPTCALACLSEMSDCSGGTDTQCLCTSTHAQRDLQECVSKDCSGEEQTRALNIYVSSCAAIGISTTASSSSTPVVSATNHPINSSTATTTSAGGAPAPTNTKGSSASSHSSDDNGSDDKITTTSTSSRSTPVGAIVGGVLGGLAALGLLGAALFMLFRRSQREERRKARRELLGAGDPEHPQPSMGQLYPASPDSSWVVKRDGAHHDSVPSPTSLVTPSGGMLQHHVAYNAGNLGNHATSRSDLPVLPAGGTAMTASGMFYGPADVKAHPPPSEMGMTGGDDVRASIVSRGIASTGTGSEGGAPRMPMPHDMTSTAAATEDLVLRPEAKAVPLVLQNATSEAAAHLPLDELKPTQREIVASLHAHGVVGAAIADVVAKMIRENEQGGSGQSGGPVASDAGGHEAPPGYEFKEARGLQ